LLFAFLNFVFCFFPDLMQLQLIAEGPRPDHHIKHIFYSTLLLLLLLLWREF